MEIYRRAMDRIHSYGLWRMIAWGEGALATIDGATFFSRGNGVAHGPSYYVLKHVPGGLHTYGAIMLVFAAYIFYSSARRGRLAKQVQFATFVLAVWVSAAVIVSWVQVNAVSFGAITKWFFIAWVALSLYLTEDKERRVATRVEGG